MYQSISGFIARTIDLEKISVIARSNGEQIMVNQKSNCLKYRIFSLLNVIEPQIQSLCHYIEIYYKKNMASASGDANIMRPLNWVGHKRKRYKITNIDKIFHLRWRYFNFFPCLTIDWQGILDSDMFHLWLMKSLINKI